MRSTSSIRLLSNCPSLWLARIVDVCNRAHPRREHWGPNATRNAMSRNPDGMHLWGMAIARPPRSLSPRKTKTVDDPACAAPRMRCSCCFGASLTLLQLLTGEAASSLDLFRAAASGCRHMPDSCPCSMVLSGVSYTPSWTCALRSSSLEVSGPHKCIETWT